MEYQEFITKSYEINAIGDFWNELTRFKGNLRNYSGKPQRRPFGIIHFLDENDREFSETRGLVYYDDSMDPMEISQQNASLIVFKYHYDENSDHASVGVAFENGNNVNYATITITVSDDVVCSDINRLISYTNKLRSLNEKCELYKP